MFCFYTYVKTLHSYMDFYLSSLRDFARGGGGGGLFLDFSFSIPCFLYGPLPC